MAAANDLSARYAKVSIEEDDYGEEDELISDKNDVVTSATETGMFLLAKLITDKPFKANVFKDVMATVWRLVEKMENREIQPALFCIQLYHESDVVRFLEEGPWTFDQHLVVINKLEMGVSPLIDLMHWTDLWVHVYDLAGCFWTGKMAQDIGNHIGSYIRTDANTFDGAWGEFMRLRVRIDIRIPLKKKMSIKTAGGDWNYIRFQYERLPSFCFFLWNYRTLQ